MGGEEIDETGYHFLFNILTKIRNTDKYIYIVQDIEKHALSHITGGV